MTESCNECEIKFDPRDAKIIVYGTGCPQCKVMENILNKAGVSYEKETDVAKMISMGFKQMPMVSVNGQIYTYQEAFKIFKTIAGKK